MKVTDFLKGREVERQAVTRYINRHEEIFKEHTKKIGKEIELDADAVAELEKVYPLPKPITIVDGVSHEDFIRVQNELIAIQQRMNELQSSLMDAQEMLATARATEMLLEDRTKRIAELEAREEAKEQEIRALQEALATERLELEKERSKSWVQKLLGK